MNILIILLQVFALALFIFLVWPNIKNEPWKKKFLENKQAFSLIVVFGLIFIFMMGLGLFFDFFFPVERLDK